MKDNCDPFAVHLFDENKKMWNLYGFYFFSKVT